MVYLEILSIWLATMLLLGFVGIIGLIILAVVATKFEDYLNEKAVKKAIRRTSEKD